MNFFKIKIPSFVFVLIIISARGGFFKQSKKCEKRNIFEKKRRSLLFIKAWEKAGGAVAYLFILEKKTSTGGMCRPLPF